MLPGGMDLVEKSYSMLSGDYAMIRGKAGFSGAAPAQAVSAEFTHRVCASRRSNPNELKNNAWHTNCSNVFIPNTEKRLH